MSGYSKKGEVNIACLQEIKWTAGQKVREIGNTDCKLWYCER